MPLPENDAMSVLKEAEPKFAALMKQAEELSAWSQKRVKEIEAELVNIEKEKVGGRAGGPVGGGWPHGQVAGWASRSASTSGWGSGL